MSSAGGRRIAPGPGGGVTVRRITRRIASRTARERSDEGSAESCDTNAELTAKERVIPPEALPQHDGGVEEAGVRRQREQDLGLPIVVIDQDAGHLEARACRSPPRQRS